MDERTSRNGDQWITLAEASRLTGHTPDALRQRARRGGLEYVKGNDGIIRVRLTSADVEGLRANASPTLVPASDDVAPRDQSTAATIKTLSDEVAMLRETLARECSRADAAEAQMAEARILGEQRSQELRQQGERAARAEGELAGVKLALGEMREVLSEARKPFWRRWAGL